MVWYKLCGGLLKRVCINPKQTTLSLPTLSIPTIQSRYAQTRDNIFCKPDPPKQKSTEISSDDSLGRVAINYSTLYKNRTGVTTGLWRLRLNQTAQDSFDPNNPPQRAPLVKKPPWQSTITVLYDFVDTPSILHEYIRFDGGVRFGKILEDMDSLAGNVAESHNDNDDGYPISFVTASVDRIDLKRRFPLNKNLVMKGTPIYVGKSSINVQICVYDKNDENLIICTANFIMVARDGITGKSAMTNMLLLDDEIGQQNFIRGRFDAQLKKEERAKQLTVIKPSSDESHLIHQFWLDINVGNNINMQDKDKYIAINKTSFENVGICQPQNLNRSGKIFGGYLMKKAYELARVTAYQFIGGLEDIYDKTRNKMDIIDQHPQFVSSDDISFVIPVSVGCIIRNESVVACTDTINIMHSENKINDFYPNRKAIMILVRTYIQEPGCSEEKLSNIFSFCYVVPKPKRAIKRVVPLTYEESMIYLQGKRALDETTKIAIREGSTFAQYL